MEIKPYNILFKFATRSRPQKFFAGLDNIINNVHDKNSFHILVSADNDDTSMYNKDTISRLIPYTKNGNVSTVFGTSKNKIDAINRDIEKINYDWDILINFSDDMSFDVYGFDNIIREKFKNHFPDTNGNIYFNDGYVGDKVSTMSIIGKSYFKTILKDKIYDPSYYSLWCDNEYTEVAIKLNKIQYINQRIYTHNQAVNLGQQKDALLVKTESYYEQDHTNYLHRRGRNFYLAA
jgi:hypothetical protein